MMFKNSEGQVIIWQSQKQILTRWRISIEEKEGSSKTKQQEENVHVHYEKLISQYSEWKVALRKEDMEPAQKRVKKVHSRALKKSMELNLIQNMKRDAFEIMNEFVNGKNGYSIVSAILFH